jgi:hypothetical protein
MLQRGQVSRFVAAGVLTASALIAPIVATTTPAGAGTAPRPYIASCHLLHETEAHWDHAWFQETYGHAVTVTAVAFSFTSLSVPFPLTYNGTIEGNKARIHTPFDVVKVNATIRWSSGQVTTLDHLCLPHGG